MQWKNTAKQFIMAAGILLWLGIMGPDVYMDAGIGCLTDEDGRALTREETQAFLEAWFYSEDAGCEVAYRSLLVDWLTQKMK